MTWKSQASEIVKLLSETRRYYVKSETFLAKMTKAKQSKAKEV